MFKKLIILLLLGGLGYVGYLAWNQYLSPRDKQKIVRKLEDTGKQLKSTASELARKGAETVKETLNDDGKTAAPASRPDSAPAK